MKDSGHCLHDNNTGTHAPVADYSLGFFVPSKNLAACLCAACWLVQTSIQRRRLSCVCVFSNQQCDLDQGASLLHFAIMKSCLFLLQELEARTKVRYKRQVLKGLESLPDDTVVNTIPNYIMDKQLIMLGAQSWVKHTDILVSSDPQHQ